MFKRCFWTPAAVLLLLVLSPAVRADEALAPGDLVVEPPTLHCLGFQWFGEGDDNLNATVEVRYRREGESEWKRAMDLVRLAPDEDRPLLAGSIIELPADTAFECRLVMKDPDGVEGRATRTVTSRTAKPAEIPRDMNVRHAYMAEYRGERQEPAHSGLLNAIWGGNLYNRRSSDWAEGGDVILLHSGYYKGKKFDKRDFRGHLIFDKSGWHGYPLGHAGGDRPLVIKAAGDGEVVIDGSGMPELFDLAGAQNVIIEGLTIQNCEIAFQFAEARNLRPSRNITIRNCTIRDVAHVAYGSHPGNRDIHITDCRLEGRQQAIIGSWGSTFSRQAITINGKGHVFSHNRVVDFFDYVNAGPASSAIDVSHNDIRRTGDNAICFNRTVKNCRAIRNRVVNGGDPQLDNRNRVGPTYWIRNVVFNQRSARGFKNDGGIGASWPCTTP